MIGHCGDTNDLDYLEKLLDAGNILGMDRFGIDGCPNDRTKSGGCSKHCGRKGAEQLVLSHDASCYIDWIEGEVPLAPLPNWHYLHINRDVIPALVQAGVSEEQIDTMLIDTPQRFLGSQNLGGY